MAAADALSELAAAEEDEEAVCAAGGTRQRRSCDASAPVARSSSAYVSDAARSPESARNVNTVLEGRSRAWRASEERSEEEEEAGVFAAASEGEDIGVLFD